MKVRVARVARVARTSRQPCDEKSNTVRARNRYQSVPATLLKALGVRGGAASNRARSNSSRTIFSRLLLDGLGKPDSPPKAADDTVCSMSVGNETNASLAARSLLIRITSRMVSQYICGRGSSPGASDRTSTCST
eukprot:scaffold37091_cov36-Tisochrysis_lutea.AAC.3